jgi:hypothetical protein
MAFILSIFDTEDYDAWKQRFDADPAGRKEAAKKHRLFRAADNPNRVYVSVEFPSLDDAKSFRERLMASGVLDDMTVVQEPTVAELAEETEY